MAGNSTHCDTTDERVTTNAGEYPDPAELIERETVERVEVTYEHDDPDHPESGYAGRTVFGVTNDDGELLAVRHVEDDVVLLPNSLVQEEGAHIPEGVAFMREAFGLEVAVDSVERVRVVAHEVDGERVGQTTHVVVEASVVGGDLDVHDDNWSGAWVSEIPGGEESGDAEADMALFLD